MDTWKEFEHNPVTHSAAHHLTAISELLEEFGYARVSDVARRLEITRGSASVTLKGLKQRGLVEEDSRRFLKLSEDGERIAAAIRAKKQIMKTLFVDVLGVDEPQAEIDTCKIEHLVSNETATRASRFLAFVQSDRASAAKFLSALSKFDGFEDADPADFPTEEVSELKLHDEGSPESETSDEDDQ